MSYDFTSSDGDQKMQKISLALALKMHSKFKITIINKLFEARRVAGKRGQNEAFAVPP